MDSILIFIIDRIYRINWIFYIPGFSLPAIAGRSGEAGGDETGYPVHPVDPVRKKIKNESIPHQNFPARNSCRKFMQKLSFPARVSAAVILAIIFLSSGLTMAPSRPLVIAITINIWFKNGRTGSP